jgi:hypothetical protein
MIGIYIITNLITNKSYIGQSINIDKRLKEHFWKANLPNDVSYKSIIHSSIRKYGKINFNSKVLIECLVEELDTLEKFYISKYNTLYPNGYNILSGGQKHRKVSKYCYCCNKLLNHYSESGLCRDCFLFSIRKVKDRPNREKLLELIFEFKNFSKVGRIYGVKASSIRRWCKKFYIPDNIEYYKVYK